MCGLSSLYDVGAGVVIVVFPVGNSRHGRYSLWAPHRPAERAALRGRARHRQQHQQRQRATAAPRGAAYATAATRKWASFFKFFFNLPTALQASHSFQPVISAGSARIRNRAPGAHLLTIKNRHLKTIEIRPHCFRVYTESLLFITKVRRIKLGQLYFWMWSKSVSM